MLWHGVGGGLHCALWNNLLKLRTRDAAMWPHTTLMDKGEANEQFHVTGCTCDRHPEIHHLWKQTWSSITSYVVCVKRSVLLYYSHNKTNFADKADFCQAHSHNCTVNTMHFTLKYALNFVLKNKAILNLKQILSIVTWPLVTYSNYFEIISTFHLWPDFGKPTILSQWHFKNTDFKY